MRSSLAASSLGRPSRTRLALARASPAITRHHSLSDHRALELGEHAHHLEEGAARRGRGVDGLLMKIQAHAEGVDLGQKPKQVFSERPSRSTDQAAMMSNRPRCLRTFSSSRCWSSVDRTFEPLTSAGGFEPQNGGIKIRAGPRFSADFWAACCIRVALAPRPGLKGTAPSKYPTRHPPPALACAQAGRLWALAYRRRCPALVGALVVRWGAARPRGFGEGPLPDRFLAGCPGAATAAQNPLLLDADLIWIKVSAPALGRDVDSGRSSARRAPDQPHWNRLRSALLMVATISPNRKGFTRSFPSASSTVFLMTRSGRPVIAIIGIVGSRRRIS